MWIAPLGDVMLGRLVNERLQAAAAEYPWGDALAVLGTRSTWREDEGCLEVALDEG